MMRLQYRLFPRLAVRRQSRRRIHRQNQCRRYRRRILRLLIHNANRPPNRTVRHPAKSRPKHRVNNHIRSQRARRNRSPLGFISHKQDFPANLAPPRKIRRRIALQLFFASKQHNEHVRRGKNAPVCAPRLPRRHRPQMPRHHKPVPAVVSLPAKHTNPAWLQPRSANKFRERIRRQRARSLHQLQPRNSMPLDRQPINFAHLRRSQRLHEQAIPTWSTAPRRHHRDILVSKIFTKGENCRGDLK